MNGILFAIFGTLLSELLQEGSPKMHRFNQSKNSGGYSGNMGYQFTGAGYNNNAMSNQFMGMNNQFMGMNNQFMGMNRMVCNHQYIYFPLIS